MDVINQGKDDTASKVEHKAGKKWLLRDDLVSSGLIPTIGDGVIVWQGRSRQRPMRFHLASTLATNIASVSPGP